MIKSNKQRPINKLLIIFKTKFMKFPNQDVLDLELPETAILETIVTDEEIIQPNMGWGECSQCKCTAYVSDSQHDGHCVCGHTAASHA
jgi:hypothetical protein